MNRLPLITAAAALGVALLASCNRSSEQRPANAGIAVDAPVDSSGAELLRSAAVSGPADLTFDAFGLRFLDAALNEASVDDNVIVSPLSAGLAVGLALQGARGSTEAALAKMLGTDTLDRATLVRRGRTLIDAADGRTDVQLEIANAVWVDSSMMLTTAFRQSTATWKAPAATLRLSSQAALDVMNAWADSVTHGKISRIFENPLPDPTALVIANAVYFKGKWLTPFEKSATVPRAFTLASGKRITRPSMTSTGDLAYRRGVDYQMVRLPYNGERAALYVILPDSGVSTSVLARRFATGERPPSLTQRDMQLVRLELPKLHVEQTLDLVPLLRRLGAGIAVDCQRSDFGDMATPRAGGQMDLCITRAVQKVYMDMDEEGTEAAAVTAIVIAPTSVPRQVEFIVNRPFLIILRDDLMGVDLFVGRIAAP